MLKGLKRVLGDTAPAPRLPISVGILRGFGSELDTGEPNQAMIREALNTAFYMLLRSGEIAVKTVSYVGPKLLRCENVRKAGPSSL